MAQESVGWSTDLWSRLDQVVHDEVQRTAVATSFIPVTTAPVTAATVPADVINDQDMTIDSSAVVSIVELTISLSLTQQQVNDEDGSGAGAMLATRAANFVAQVEDLLIFQGSAAVPTGPLQNVQVVGTVGLGLLAAATHHVVVPTSGAPHGIYGENTFDAVVNAMTLLRSRGQSGPYALALSPTVYADTFVPVTGTLVMAADQIRPLVAGGFVDAPALPDGSGLLVSLGGNTVDLVVSVEPTMAFTQVDDQGSSQFRVYERLALRVKDAMSLVQFEFQNPI